MDLSLDSMLEDIDSADSFSIDLSSLSANNSLSFQFEEVPTLSLLENDEFFTNPNMLIESHVNPPANEWWNDFRVIYNANFEEEKIMIRLRDILVISLRKMSKTVLVEIFRAKLGEMMARGGSDVLVKYKTLFHLLSCVRKVQKKMLVVYVADLVLEPV